MKFSFLVISVSFDDVMGKCYVAHGDNFESPRDWSEKGPFRFYFTEMYNLKTHKFDEVPIKARRMGTQGKGKGKGRSQYQIIFAFLLS